MQHRNQQQESHLPEIIRLLSTYHALSILQLEVLYPELPQQKLLLLLKKLEKNGRLTLMPERDLVLHTGDSVPNPSILAAFWVLLDFREDITYHTASDFPVTLTFYTQSDTVYHCRPYQEDQHHPLQTALHKLHLPEPTPDAEPLPVKPVAGDYRQLRYAAIPWMHGRADSRIYQQPHRGGQRGSIQPGKATQHMAGIRLYAGVPGNPLCRETEVDDG